VHDKILPSNLQLLQPANEQSRYLIG